MIRSNTKGCNLLFRDVTLRIAKPQVGYIKRRQTGNRARRREPIEVEQRLTALPRKVDPDEEDIAGQHTKASEEERQVGVAGAAHRERGREEEADH